MWKTWSGVDLSEKIEHHFLCDLFSRSMKISGHLFDWICLIEHGMCTVPLGPHLRVSAFEPCTLALCLFDCGLLSRIMSNRSCFNPTTDEICPSYLIVGSTVLCPVDWGGFSDLVFWIPEKTCSRAKIPNASYFCGSDVSYPVITPIRYENTIWCANSGK